MEQIQLPKVKKRRFKRYFPLFALVITLAAIIYFVNIIATWKTTPEKISVKQLCEQLVRDLKADTTNLSKVILYDSQLLHKNDSLETMLLDTLQKPDSVKMRRLILSGSRVKVFRPNMKGVLQLQENYNLKEISGTKIPQYVSDYQNSLDTLNSLTDLQLHDLNTDMRSFLKAHFVPKKDNSIYATAVQANGINGISKEDMDDFNASISVIEDNNNSIVENSIRAKNKAARLIAYVKKLYHL